MFPFGIVGNLMREKSRLKMEEVKNRKYTNIIPQSLFWMSLHNRVTLKNKDTKLNNSSLSFNRKFMLSISFDNAVLGGGSIGSF